MIFTKCHNPMVFVIRLGSVTVLSVHVILGVNDHLQPINSSVWIYAMANESKGKLKFFPYTFEFQANRILDGQFGITRSDITAENHK